MKNRSFASVRDYGVEICFKKWAKLEAYGNLNMLPAVAVLWAERLIDCGARIANIAGGIMEKLTGKLRWKSATLIALEQLVRRLSNRKKDADLPDAFLLEIYNPTAAAVRMQLNFVSLASPVACREIRGLPPSFVTTIDLPQGYSQHRTEFSLLRLVSDSGRPFLISLIPEADCNARLVLLTADFVKLKRTSAKAPEPKNIKCIVWDLDNTLWKGVLAEGDEVALRPEIPSLLKHLDDRGILLSIASKNDPTAWRTLQKCGISDFFVAPRINWARKSENVRAIAKRLNIGLDTFAFVDDSPFELDEVSRRLPEVVCIHADAIPSLFADPRFQGSASAESRRRRKLYQEAAVREEARAQFGSDYVAFLRACEITLEVIPYSSEEYERIAELVQRTNQLNFSGRRYSRDQLRTILDEPGIEKLILKCCDRYGSYGTIGFGLIEHGGSAIRIVDLMLSCRVQGKLLEQAFFGHLFEHHNPQTLHSLWVNFQESARNKPAQQVLESLGFRRCNSRAEFPGGMICASRESLRCDFIEVRCSAESRPTLAKQALAFQS